MKTKVIFLFLIVQLMIAVTANCQELPAKKTVLQQMVLANKYFMDKWPDPGADIVTDKVRPSNLWTRAAYYEGLMALYYMNRDTSYYNYAVEWGESHDWKPTYGNLFTRDADHQCCGQTYIELYLIDKKPERIQPIKECIDYIVADADADDWSWIDAIQMGMPLFAKLGVVFNDTAYFRKMNDMYMYSKNQHGENGLYNPEEHLWWRDGNFDPPYETPDGKNCYWSRGNGWVITALARVLDVLPDTSEYREEYITTFKEMSDALIKLQRYDGFWNSSLADSNDYGGKETSGTAFFAYGLAWGINNHILDSATFMPYVVKAWNGMIKYALHDNGFLGYVQGTGKEPKDGQPLSYTKAANFEDYGLGAFLLAGSEVYKLAPDTVINPPSSVKKRKRHSANFSVYPNPVISEMTLHYTVHQKSSVRIQIFDLQGRNLSTVLEKQEQNPGEFELTCDIKQLPLGSYFICFTSDNEVITRKFISSF